MLGGLKGLRFLLPLADIFGRQKQSNKSLEEKVAHNRERIRLQEVLRQHRLNYFELVKAAQSCEQQVGTSVKKHRKSCIRNIRQEESRGFEHSQVRGRSDWRVSGQSELPVIHNDRATGLFN